MNTTVPTVADIYCRKSSDDRGRSAADQETECRTDVVGQGWTVGRVFADPDRSASRYAKKARPDYEALLAHIESGQCVVLTVWETSRGTRRVGEGDALLDLCRKHGVLIRVVSAGRTFDVSKRSDWRQLIGEMVDAADESERTSERSLRGHRMIAARGLPGGQVPYGYRREYDQRRKFAAQPAHPEQAAVVRRIFAEIDAGTDMMALARTLNDEKIPAPEGGIWRSTTLRKLAMNPRYVGERVHKGQVVGPAKWPALVERDMFDRVNARLSDPARIGHSRGTALRWLLPGVPRCGRCRVGRLRTFWGGRSGEAKRRYLCPCGLVIQAEPLDEFVEKALLDWLRSPAALAAATSAQDTPELQLARDEVQALQDRLDEYRLLVAQGKLSPAGLVPVEARLLPNIETARQKVRALTRPALAPDPATVVAGWDAYSVEQRRAVVVAFTDLWVAPGLRGRAFFDWGRLGESRWLGDTRTWAQHWADL